MKTLRFFGYLILIKKMATVDKIRSGLINKILTIKNKDFLEALDKLIFSS